MRTTKERMDELKRHVHTERRRRQTRGAASLSVACVTLYTCLLSLTGGWIKRAAPGGGAGAVRLRAAV